MKKTTRTAKDKPTNDSSMFSAEERAAMRARAKELKADALKENNESSVIAAIEAMSEPDLSTGMRLHAILKTNAPGLSPKTWYGMPAYANADGKVICFFRGSDKFKERYLTFGFNQEAKLDDGAMWPIAFAITSLTPEVEERLATLVKKAVGEAPMR